ncbi:MAG: hypothetical protein P4M14_04135, partial [Gammaproteobacteria bacterium]|nr:hypothetical protein [Gammaproteobacteria bacterium]
MSKAKAIKLAKELNAPIPKNADWKALAQEYEQEKRYNALVDFFNQEKAKIFQVRKTKVSMKNLMNEVKNHKRNRIEMQIKVEPTDPPTVTRDSVQNAIDGVNFDDYTVAFSVTITKQTLDEYGNLESETDETSPEEPIANKEFLKKYERRTVGALTGFFNNYMVKLSKSLAIVQHINLILTKRVKKPQRLMPLKEAMTTNCLIDIVDGAVKKRKEYV